MKKELDKRSNGKCELCASEGELSVHIVEPKSGNNSNDCINICSLCNTQLMSGNLDANRWRCLNDSIWSEVNAVKVIAWRILNTIKNEGWPNDLLAARSDNGRNRRMA